MRVGVVAESVFSGQVFVDFFVVRTGRVANTDTAEELPNVSRFRLVPADDRILLGQLLRREEGRVRTGPLGLGLQEGEHLVTQFHRDRVHDIIPYCFAPIAFAKGCRTFGTTYCCTSSSRTRRWLR